MAKTVDATPKVIDPIPKVVDPIPKLTNSILNIIFGIYTILSIAPLLLVIAVSFTDEKTIYKFGYNFIPKQFSLGAYKFVFTDVDQVLRAYGVTFFVTIVGGILSLLLISLLAYPLSRKDFKYRNALSFFVFFTILFSGGFVPWYIVCTQFLHLKDTIWALIAPYLINSWYVIIMKTFYQNTIPDSLLEAARIDGAGEFKTFFSIVLPLSVPGLATIGLFIILRYWNDWWLPLTLINDNKLFNLQFLMYQVQLDIQYLKSARTSMTLETMKEIASIPSETSRMAMCIVAIGPIIVAYPFLQKYFVKGLTIGSVKG